MKIAFFGLDLPEGKVKYPDVRLLELENKVSPQKTHSLFLELIRDIEAADIIICHKEKILDILIPDLEKIERRLAVSTDNLEKELLSKCNKVLEEEVPLYDLDLSQEDIALIKTLQLQTLKPVVIEQEHPQDLTALLKKSLDKAKVIFFYTIVKAELRSWPIKKGVTVIEAAAKIHSDLARGFIKAEVINFKDFMSVHNINEAKTKNKVKLVDKDYIVEDGDIVEIRFNV